MGMVRARVLAVGLCFAAVGFGIGCGDAKADRTASTRGNVSLTQSYRRPTAAAGDGGIHLRLNWQWRVAVQMHEGAAHRRTTSFSAVFFCFDRFRRGPFRNVSLGTGHPTVATWSCRLPHLSEPPFKTRLPRFFIVPTRGQCAIIFFGGMMLAPPKRKGGRHGQFVSHWRGSFIDGCHNHRLCARFARAAENQCQS
jgi:hypothetical protein